MNRWLHCAYLISLLAVPAVAADFPTKPIRVIVPWPAGGSTDTIARVIGQRLTVIAGQPVVIDNRGGAAGTIGANIASKATPDGYTLVVVEGSHLVMPATTAGLGYDLARDFAPLTLIGISPFVVFLHAGLPVKSLADFIAIAKSKPGLVPAAHTGVGSFTHLCIEMLQMRTGVKFNQVSYKGAAPAVIDLASGEVHMYMATYASGAGMLRTGRIRVIAVAGEKRMAVVPEVPTLGESGIKDMVVIQFFGYLAPVRVPPAVQARLHKDLVAAIEDASVRERLTELAVDVTTSTPERLKAHIVSELQRWAVVARNAGITPQ
jgi:tripartite-type tricarboxylate transporter receptor subunit TctC